MALFRIRPTRADIEIAEWIADHTRPETEQIAEILTWGADEHVICALMAGLLQGERRQGTDVSSNRAQTFDRTRQHVPGRRS